MFGKPNETLTTLRCGYRPGVAMDIFRRNISMHYIRVHFGYAPRTLILNALEEREERI